MSGGSACCPPPPELFPPIPWSTPGESCWTRIPLVLYSAACCAAPPLGKFALFLASRSASSSFSLDRIDLCELPA